MHEFSPHQALSLKKRRLEYSDKLQTIIIADIRFVNKSSLRYDTYFIVSIQVTLFLAIKPIFKQVYFVATNNNFFFKFMFQDNAQSTF